jgi:hypothetical protein
MPSHILWPQPPSPLQNPLLLPSRERPGPPSRQPRLPTGLLPPSRPNRPLSYMEQLRQASSAQAAPYVELLRATPTTR